MNKSDDQHTVVQRTTKLTLEKVIVFTNNAPGIRVLLGDNFERYGRIQLKWLSEQNTATSLPHTYEKMGRKTMSSVARRLGMTVPNQMTAEDIKTFRIEVFRSVTQSIGEEITRQVDDRGWMTPTTGMQGFRSEEMMSMLTISIAGQQVITQLQTIFMLSACFVMYPTAIYTATAASAGWHGAMQLRYLREGGAFLHELIYKPVDSVKCILAMLQMSFQRVLPGSWFRPMTVALKEGDGIEGLRSWIEDKLSPTSTGKTLYIDM